MSISSDMVRSNVFVRVKTHKFLKDEAKARHASTGEIVDLAVRALKREKLRQKMIQFYDDPSAQQEERSMAEASFVIHSDNE